MAWLVAGWSKYDGEHISKDDVAVETIDGIRVLTCKPCKLCPSGLTVKEDDHHRFVWDDEAGWKIEMGPLPMLCAYNSWDEVPDDVKWWWDDESEQVEIMAGPPAMRGLDE